MDRQKLVELKCAIIGASQTDREVVRGIHLRKALVLVDEVLEDAAADAEIKSRARKAAQSKSDVAELFRAV
jgi:hypothetical protein